MKVFAISDLHLSINNPKPMDIFGGAWDNYLEKINESWNEKVSADDVVLIAGDISWAMNLDAAKPDLDYIGSLKGRKIITRGNHDYWWKSVTNIRSCLKSGMYALQNDAMRLDGFVFCGTRGWTVPIGAEQSDEDKKIYQRELIRLSLALDAADKKRESGDKLIVMIHYPPFNHRFEPSDFTKLLSERKADAVVYGHLHGKQARSVDCLKLDGVDYYLTSCDLIGNELKQIF